MFNNIYKIALRINLILFFIITLLGCEENDTEPLTSSELTIVVNSLNQSDIDDQGILKKDENISNNSGNPWGEFIKELETECGNSPKQFEIVSVSVQVDGKENVSSFEDVISGSATVYFINTQGSDEDAIKVNIGSSSQLLGSAPIELTNFATASDLDILNSRLIGGDFHVGFSGKTSLTKDDVFSMDVIIKFIVRSYCD